MQDGTDTKTKNNVEDQFDTDPELADQTTEQTEEIMKVNPFADLLPINNKIKTQEKKMEKVLNEQPNLLGIDNLKKVVKAGASLVNDVVESYTDDGKFTGGDFKNFLTTIPDVIMAIPSIGEAGKEIADKITPEEFAELKSTIVAEIDFEDPLDDEFTADLVEWANLTGKLVKNRIEKKKQSKGE
ncbi:MAG: hypothetical protein WC549_02125 [Actinomycetota bacterium]